MSKMMNLHPCSNPMVYSQTSFPTACPAYTKGRGLVPFQNSPLVIAGMLSSEGGRPPNAPECTLSPSGRRGTTTNESTTRIGGRDSSERAKPALSEKHTLEPRGKMKERSQCRTNCLTRRAFSYFSCILLMSTMG